MQRRIYIGLKFKGSKGENNKKIGVQKTGSVWIHADKKVWELAARGKTRIPEDVELGLVCEKTKSNTPMSYKQIY